jgi:hypothetical protein
MKPRLPLNFSRAFSGIFLIALFISLSARPASADFTFIRVVGSAFSTTEKTVFAPSETPFLYVKLPAAGNSVVNSFWSGPQGSLDFTRNFSNGDERWLSPSGWNTPADAGEWEIGANYFFPSGASGSGSVNFTVTPEPVSTALFLAGGVPMAWGLYRRRKYAAIPK